MAFGVATGRRSDVTPLKAPGIVNGTWHRLIQHAEMASAHVTLKRSAWRYLE